MKRFIFGVLFLIIPISLQSENYLINGGQNSRINYVLTQRVEPAGDTKYLKLSFVVPQSFDSPTYKQRIENYRLDLKPQPSEQNKKTDKRGNHIVNLEWKNPSQPVDVAMHFTATTSTDLKPLKSIAPYPLTRVPGEYADYLKPTGQIQSDNREIQSRAESLVRGVKTEFDAVQRILTWVVDNMRYVTPPKQYDALYSFNSGKGNCQNYSHLSAALMRHAGIPVRIVNGVTLKEPYTIKTPDGEFTFKMGQGRHSWIEVWFSDLGWVPFDPQQTELFVSNRFVRLEIGVDNNECVNDGTVKWRQARGVSGRPTFREAIEADFTADQVRLSMEKQNYGPKNMLLVPHVQAAFQEVIVKTPPPPKKVSQDRLDQMLYIKPFLFGNLDFPKGVNFFEARTASRGQENEYMLKKNFMVETAEFVTEKNIQYAQIFVLKKPLKLAKIGLAMKKFGGSGQIWIELMNDVNGMPGNIIATSDFMDLSMISSKQSYDWVDFNLQSSNLRLSPGRYWIRLGFTGGPILNWFYTYGKPVGPVEGTRYKGVFDNRWSGAMSYEFNYRVAGYTVE
ncbi:transglutaminase domain-containing protein [bacterium]|nr:transglutaminase domain-containing protein [bacterium]